MKILNRTDIEAIGNVSVRHIQTQREQGGDALGKPFLQEGSFVSHKDRDKEA